MKGYQLQQLSVLSAALTLGVVLSQNVPPPAAARTGFACPRERGAFEVPGDCSRYYLCDGGVSVIRSCQDRLAFNPRTEACDWPENVPNCLGVSSAQLTPQTSQVCGNNPDNRREAFIVPSPQLCNAFITCGPYFLYHTCTFCGDGMYFSLEEQGCRVYQPNQDLAALCGNRRFVPHEEKVLTQLDGTCWHLANVPSPHEPLVAAIRSGAIQPPTQRPG